MLVKQWAGHNRRDGWWLEGGTADGVKSEIIARSELWRNRQFTWHVARYYWLNDGHRSDWNERFRSRVTNRIGSITHHLNHLIVRSMSETLSEQLHHQSKSIARSETALELERESRASPDSLKSLNSLDFESPIDFKFKVLSSRTRSILFMFKCSSCQNTWLDIIYYCI